MLKFDSRTAVIVVALFAVSSACELPVTRPVSPAWARFSHFISAESCGAVPTSEFAHAVQTEIRAATKNAKPER